MRNQNKKHTVKTLREIARLMDGELGELFVGYWAAQLLVAARRIEAEDKRFDLRAHLARQREFSDKTFGPGRRTQGVCDHIRKELIEVERAPDDLGEWIDVVILALDGAGRTGATPDQIIAALVAKQTKNEGRTWPDWRTQPADKAIEHDRSAEGQS